MGKLDYEKVFNTLVKETREYVTNNRLQCMVLGISGGIDSTVVAAICHEVSKNTGISLIGRSLPIKNKDDEFTVSKLVGGAFCNDFKCIPLQTSYIAVLNNLLFEEADDFTHANDVSDAEYWVENKQTPIANGNIQARLRMIYLYNLASIHKGLVMSTDNQTEYQLGFWTIHGDVGDFNPLQDLWKTEVYELANWIREYYKKEYETVKDKKYSTSILDKETILDRINALEQSIALTPTDGLGISNSDLEQIGAKSYNEIDDILQTMLNFASVKFVAGQYLMYDKYGKEVTDKVWNRHVASEFKRKKAPIYIPRSKYELGDRKNDRGCSWISLPWWYLYNNCNNTSYCYINNVFCMKMYYGALALIWLLSGCADSSNVSNSTVIGTRNYYNIKEFKIDGHSYIKLFHGLSHSGSCKQCKHELDSIVKNAVNEAFEASMEENWNE